MEGIVTSFRQSPGGSYCLLGLENGRLRSFQVGKELALELGELVVVENDSAFPSAGSDPYRAKLEDAVRSGIEALISGRKYSIGVEDLDLTTERMWKNLSSAARLLLRKLLFGAPVIVRFHNDADGSSGAVALYRGIGEVAGSFALKPNTIWVMHRGVSYGKADAESDTLISRNYSSIEKPLLIIIDFGTSPDSNDGIAAANAGFDIIWLDHHPIVDGFSGSRLENYISPWQFGSGSEYTAGLLACAFSKTFSACKGSEVLGAASLIGDCSRLAPNSSAGEETAMVLDLLTSEPGIASGSDGNLTPSEIESVLGDVKRCDELYNYAKMRLDETTDAALKSLKVSDAKIAEIFVLDYGRLRSNESRYPLPGRFASRLLVKLEEEGRRPVLILHFDLYISMRVGQDLGGMVDLPGVIRRAREMYPDLIESGGGHANAASIKLRSIADKKVIISAVSDMIRSNLSS